MAINGENGEETIAGLGYGSTPTHPSLPPVRKQRDGAAPVAPRGKARAGPSPEVRRTHPAPACSRTMPAREPEMRTTHRRPAPQEHSNLLGSFLPGETSCRRCDLAARREARQPRCLVSSAIEVIAMGSAEGVLRKAVPPHKWGQPETRRHQTEGMMFAPRSAVGDGSTPSDCSCRRPNPG
jgi:hypothetical protein